MDIRDALTSDIPNEVKEVLLDMLDEERFSSTTLILKPRDSNDDLNGSQHAVGGGTDFTYEDASYGDLSYTPLTFGYYDHFAREDDHYTGHSYHGDGWRFGAVVVNPPEYAVSHRV